jgi:hypothetical protein
MPAFLIFRMTILNLALETHFIVLLPRQHQHVADTIHDIEPLRAIDIYLMKVMPTIGSLHPLLIHARPTSLCQRICVKLFFRGLQQLLQQRLRVPAAMGPPTTMSLPEMMNLPPTISPNQSQEHGALVNANDLNQSPSCRD